MTTLEPALPPPETLAAERATAAAELQWFLSQLPSTLSSITTTLHDSHTLLTTPTSTLPLSTPRSELLKGILTRTAASLTRADITLKHPHLPAHLTLPTPSLPLPQLIDVTALVTAAASLPPLPSDPALALLQLKKLQDYVTAARDRLRGVQPHALFPYAGEWTAEGVVVDAYIYEAAVVVEVHAVEKVEDAVGEGVGRGVGSPFGFRERFAVAVGLRDGERGEGGRIVSWKGGRWRVGVEVRVESQDPCLMAVWAKLGGLGHVLAGTVRALEVVGRAAEVV